MQFSQTQNHLVQKRVCVSQRANCTTSEMTLTLAVECKHSSGHRLKRKMAAVGSSQQDLMDDSHGRGVV